MMEQRTAERLVDVVEDRVKAAGEEWSYPCIIERLRELADDLRDQVECDACELNSVGEAVAAVQLHEQDHAWLTGLAAALEEAIL